MKFSKGLLPPSYGPWEVLLILFAFSGAVLLTLAVVSSLTPGGALGQKPPQVAATMAHLPAATSTPPGPLIIVRVSSPTNTLVVRSPTPGAPGPTPIPTATRFWVVPARPTPIPTPELPPAAPFPTSCDGPGRMNILVIGIDGFDANYYRAARSDAIILVGVNFSAKNAQMLSVPRDLWVQLPNILQVPEARINTAYHYGEYYQVPGGGPAELSTTVANTLGLRIDRYLVVNFLAFEQGVDTIGGIDLNLAAPLHDSRYPLRDGSGTIAIDFPAGWVHMDGATALIYARIRHDSNDFTRMRRQQQVLFAIRDKLLSPETIPQLPALAQILIGAVRTNLTLDDISLLGCLGPQISRDAVQAWVLDNSMVRSARLEDGAQVLLPNMDAILPILQNFNTGE